MEQTIEMAAIDGTTIALQSVHITGQISGLLLSTSIRQQYYNDSGKALEVVYTFPLGWDSSLLGMEVEIGSKRLQGVVIEKKEAEAKYEKAIEEGDTPVMVQESSPGLYTANLGNIKAGESIGVEIRTAQLLRFEQDQIRVKIPTVIAPRYGDPHKDGGLAPHESDGVDFLVRYPFTICLNITGETAKAKITSPSHKTVITATDNDVSVLLESEAALDRDFILLLQGLAGHSFALSVADEEHHTMLASFCPKLPVKADPLLLKILVDCSGSMAGDSIWQARKALQTILRELSPQDFISFSRFGDRVNHATRSMEQCTPEALQKLFPIVKRMDAGMGGTEMENAVLSTCKEVSLPENTSLRPSLLLITDDLYWNNGSILRAAMESGHRFFTVGVGSAPAECLLREIAEKTGGACAFVTPNEDMAAVIVRMFRRMRTSQTNKLSISWGSEPAWQSSLPASIFDGETLHLFASFTEAPMQVPTLSWKADGKINTATPEFITATENRDVARLGAAQRIKTASKQEALSIALKYQLVSDQSSLFLVYLRESEDKVTELPEIHQVPQMMAAGSHGYGSVVCDINEYCRMSKKNLNISAFMRYESESEFSLQELKGEFFGEEDLESVAHSSPHELLKYFDKQALAYQDYAHVLTLIQIHGFTGADYVPCMIADFANQEGITLEQAWAVFLDWLMIRLVNEYRPSRHAKRLLRSQMKTFGRTRRTAFHTVLNSRFSDLSVTAWKGTE